MTYASNSCVISLIKSYLLRFIVTCSIPFLFLGCSSQDSANTDGQGPTTGSKPVVFVPISPYQFIFEKIAGDLIDIKVIVGEGDDPHSYSPTPKQIVDMAKANLLCSGELGFESNYFVKLGDGKTGPLELNLLEKFACAASSLLQNGGSGAGSGGNTGGYGTQAAANGSKQQHTKISSSK